jgi:IclR family acetate operon transcriptional repressor
VILSGRGDVANQIEIDDGETAPVPVATETTAPRGGIQSVDRALSLMLAIADQGGEATLSALSECTGLNISTCHHLLATLIRRGFVAKSVGRRGYVLGTRILFLSQACQQVELPRLAEPFVDRINRSTGETVHLAVLQGDEIATVLKRQARYAVRVDAGTLGKSSAVHATSTGKAILAWLPEEDVVRIVTSQGMRAFTPDTITDFTALIEELRVVRRNGYAMDREEFQPGVVCVGAPIRDHTGRVVGSISASAPAMRADAKHIEMMRDEVIAAANDLTEELNGAAEPDKAKSRLGA